MSKYRGTGGDKPDPTKQAFKKSGPEFYLSETLGDKDVKVVPFMVKLGQQNVPVVTLDDGDMDYAVNLHSRFQYNGSWSNYAVCTKRSEKGCPLCDVLEKPSQWFLCGSLLDRSEWAVPSGKNKGKIYKDKRRLLLITASQVDSMEMIGKKIKSWRGADFDVGRSSDNKSPRIGSSWFFNGRITEDEMKEAFAEAANEAGVPVEEYIKPFDYTKILAPKSYEELLEMSLAIKKEQAAATAPAMTKNEEAVPF